MIEFISLGGAASGKTISSDVGAAEKLSHIADINRLARSHKDVSIMFMDIVGERGGSRSLCAWIMVVSGEDHTCVDNACERKDRT